ncbi:MAG: cysteine desulfurase family protein [Clostridia bacterium]
MGYLDNSATTKVYKEVADVVYDVMINNYGNPSSLHKIGRDAKEILDNSSKNFAKTINCKPDEVIFTSGGTESINTAAFSTCKKLGKRGKHIVATEIEHSATINVFKELRDRGFEVDFIKPTADGSIDVELFASAIREDTIFASVMMVNNEIGSILPIKELCKVFKEKSKFGLFHVDAVQAFCKIPIDVQALGIDLMSVSGHKIGAPKGVGALYIKKGSNLPPYIYGGGQQREFRSGTENLASIAGFSKAIDINREKYDSKYIEKLANYLDEMLAHHFADNNFCYNGKADIPNIRNFSIPKIKSEVALRVLESHGTYVSSGSACTKGKISYVLLNMGIDKTIADGSIRVSFSMENTKDDIDLLIRGLTQCVNMFC